MQNLLVGLHFRHFIIFSAKYAGKQLSLSANFKGYIKTSQTKYVQVIGNLECNPSIQKTSSCFLTKKRGNIVQPTWAKFNACPWQLDPMCIMGCLALQTLTRQKGIKSQEVWYNGPNLAFSIQKSLMMYSGKCRRRESVKEVSIICLSPGRERGCSLCHFEAWNKDFS